MSHTPHELADEFPADHALLHELKLNNPHFVTLADRYHAVNGEIHRIEAGVETTSDEYAERSRRSAWPWSTRLPGSSPGPRPTPERYPRVAGDRAAGAIPRP